MFNKWITGAALFLILSPVMAQTKKDSLGLPGDNFDLYGALELFKKAETPEAFEKALNTNDNEVNNLDLDGDGKVDYVNVVDKTEGNIHSVVMQVAVSKDELQDVAVIEIEKTGDKTAHVQIVGDEELYGKDYIIEPGDGTAAAHKKGGENLATDNNQDDVYARSDEPTVDDTDNRSSSSGGGGGGGVTVINVWGWPSVQYMYGPSYAAWASPWYYGYYPGWYNPWYPVYWRVYHRRVWHYHQPYYRRAYFYRSPVAHNYYYGRRSAASTVRAHNRSGYYHQRQQAYKSNVQPGRRYNASPANPRGTRARQSTPDNRPRNSVRSGQRGRSEGTSPRSNQRVNSGTRSGNTEHRQSSPRQRTDRQTPRQQQPRINSQPRQVSPQAPAGGNRGSGSSPRGGSGGSPSRGNGDNGGNGRSGR